MTSLNIMLEDLINQCGGQGLFQWILVAIILVTKMSLTWSMLMMSFGGAIPDWWCTENSTLLNNTEDTEFFKNDSMYMNCLVSGEENQCDQYHFGSEMSTVVNEWKLVCSKAWIVSTITTIQMAGVLAGGLIAGQVADTIGRKPTFFLAIFDLLIFNIVAFFSVSWQMFAVMRFFIGFGCGFYLTVFFPWAAEFMNGKWRSVMSALPAWPFWAGLYALAAWLIRDWKYIHIATGVVCAPFLLFWWATPESFRWLVAHGKMKEAEMVINKMAKINGRLAPDLTKMKELVIKELHREKDKVSRRHYTFKDLFVESASIKNTFLVLFMWFTCGFAYYGMAFGVQSLSGNLYLNLFLMGFVEAPAQFSIQFLNNWFGRRKTCMGYFLFAGLCALAVAITQLTDSPHIEIVTNVFAIASKFGLAAAWAALIVYTSEIYPTVVRNIAFGLHNTGARVGAMVAPQIVFLNIDVPGLFYFLCGGVSLLSVFATALLKETRDLALEDMLVPDIIKDHKETVDDTKV